ncbi:hypothetical protein ACETAC_05455 [Aceticella autotrophica]|uniref:Uncharacterized protein n=1 Tax=Aceticella autotrophica TaxID=2755338 RepID=A0A974Y2K9_9THEO|nr:hypothetical protein [Aceticella autotrophica]QSZ26391.1 hypothetical protein ACETAC_05455 [Aceticella autotrophica]
MIHTYITKTLKGFIGCIDRQKGNIIWGKGMYEGCIVSPPSLYGNSLFILADCSLYLIDKISGIIYQRKAVGHSPYSACSILSKRVVIGGGEPPSNGILISYLIKENMLCLNEIISYYETGNYTENSNM